MCLSKPPAVAKPRTPLAAYDSGAATEAATLEARLRRRRAGAAADILTGPVGIPSTATLGGVAQ